MSQNHARKGFTLIELLVVVAIIALLMAILLPSLATARERARRVGCAAQMHGVGTGVQVFAAQLQNRVPCQRNDNGSGPWMTSMNAADYFFLIDSCGSNLKLFLENFSAKPPSNAPEDILSYGSSGGTGGYFFPDTEANCRLWSTTDYTEDPSDPRWNSGTARCDFVLFPFQWYGVEKYGPQAAQASNQLPWSVYLINQPSAGGTNSGITLQQDYNPPIMSDYAMHYTTEDRYNHGTSFQYAYTNVLRVDGSVVGKTVDPNPFGVMYGSFYFYR